MHQHIIRLFIFAGLGLLFFLPNSVFAQACEYGDPFKRLNEKNARQEFLDSLTPLIEAAADGKVERIVSLVERGDPIDATDIDGMTPLMWAASSDQLEAVEKLIALGANIDARTHCEETALFFISSHRNPEISRSLLRHGADPTVADVKGNTPMMRMVGALANLEVMGDLIDAGANIDAQDSNGTTALMDAARRRVPDQVAFLLERGADPNLADVNGLTALAVAAHVGSLKSAQLLLSNGANLEAVNPKKRTPLMAAAAGGRHEMIEFLLSLGAKIDARDGEDLTAIEYAVREKKMRATLLLLELGADVSQSNLVAFAVWKKLPIHVVKALLDHGANPNAKERDGKTGLHTASFRGQRDYAELLISYGANLEAKGPRGDTPLIFAAANGKAELVTLLLGHGARINARNDKGETALDQALEYGEKEAALALLSAVPPAKLEVHDEDGPLFPPMVRAVIYAEDKAFVEAIMRAVDDADLKSPIMFDVLQSLIYLAAKLEERNALDYIDIVLARGVSPNVSDKYRLSAFMIAVATGDPKVIELMIKYGASFDFTTDAGDTILHYASLAPSVNFLRHALERGIDPNAVGRSGRTALHVAAQSGPIESVRLLLNHGADPSVLDDEGVRASDLASSDDIRILIEANE